MASIQIEFQNKQGNQLTGVLDTPNCKPKAFGIFAHCFTCSKSSKGATYISRVLAEKGFGILRFDFTGLGNSEGEFGKKSISGDIADLKAAADFLRDNFAEPKLLVGHSLGGAAVLRAVKDMPSVEAVATIGAPGDPRHLTHVFSDGARQKLAEEGTAEVDIGGRPFNVRQTFIDDLESFSVSDIEDLRVPLLVLHAPFDNVVGIDNAGDIFVAAKHPKSFVSLDDADHLLTNRKDARYAAEVIAGWATRYLSPLDDHSGAHDKTSVAAPSARGKFLTEVCTSGHELLADEPKDVGGDNLGPTPYDFLCSSLAACTSMTIGMYAARKKWDVSNVRVLVSHEREYVSDCENCEQDNNAKIDVFRRVLSIPDDGRLDSEQMDRLQEIADKCPVHKSLATENRIETTVEVGDNQPAAV